MQIIISKIIYIYSFISSIFNTKHKTKQQNYKFHVIKRGVFLKSHLKKSIYANISSLALNLFSIVQLSSNMILETKNSIRFKTMDLTSKFYNYFSNVFSVQPTIYYLRKQKLFNKGRYSRNRQTYRTGALWSLWVNILAVTGFYYWFYRFSMNFGYVWPFLSLFVISFILPRAIKYNYFSFFSAVQSITKLFYWFYLVFSSFIRSFFLIVSNLAFFNKNLVSLNSLYTGVFFNYITNILILILSSFYFIYDRNDLLLKNYSHWNYFLPLGWIHRHHRSFFFSRVYYIIFSNKFHN